MVIAGLICRSCPNQKIDPTGACIADKCMLFAESERIEREKVKFLKDMKTSAADYTVVNEKMLT